MDQITSSKNEFILGLSLSELAFLYFMLLLLISLFMMKEHKVKIDERDETIDQQNIVITGLKREDFDPHTWMVDIKNLKDKVIDLNEDNKQLKKDLESKGSNKDDTVKNFSKFFKKLNLYGLDDHQLESKLNEFAGAKEKALKLSEENLTLKKKLKKLEKGWDKFPCFYYINNKMDVKERPKYIYDVEIEDELYGVTPTWMKNLGPKERKNYIGRIKGAPKSNTKLMMNPKEFVAFGKKHKIDGEKKEYDCRHHVRVWDKTSNDKKFWQQNFSTLETYFYKKCMTGCK
jgi:hypothetical protein